LGGVMDNDENDGRNTQRVDEVQPFLVIIVQKMGSRNHAKPPSVEDEGAFTLPGLMHIKRLNPSVTHVVAAA
jgi:hypothetical protein